MPVDPPAAPSDGEINAQNLGYGAGALGSGPAEPQPVVAVGDRGDGRYEADADSVVRARFTTHAAAPPEPMAYEPRVREPGASDLVEDIAAPMHDTSVWDARPTRPA